MTTNKVVNNQLSSIGRASAREEVNPITSKAKRKYTPKPKKEVITKLQIIDEVMNSDEDKTFTLSVSEFKSLFKTAQINRGWTKPQIEFIKEKLSNG